MRRIVLIRHGQTAWNLEGRAQGHTDTPLDEIGERQAQQLALALRGEPFDEIWSTDLQRGLATAQAIHKQMPVPLKIFPALRERSFGSGEGRPFAEIRDEIQFKIAKGANPDQVRTDKGESTAQVAKRLATMVTLINSSPKNLVVVSHGGTSSLLLALLLRCPNDVAQSFRFDNAAITELESRPNGVWVLRRYNDTSFLDTTRTPMVDLAHGC
ncbi:MAG: histidine phosphatase family protein [Armatimonadetes bacterium]|nr:histidine phosphatase family protein [Armatimonadota bacterium]